MALVDENQAPISASDAANVVGRIFEATSVGRTITSLPLQQQLVLVACCLTVADKHIVKADEEELTFDDLKSSLSKVGRLLSLPVDLGQFRGNFTSLEAKGYLRLGGKVAAPVLRRLRSGTPTRSVAATKAWKVQASQTTNPPWELLIPYGELVSAMHEAFPIFRPLTGTLAKKNL